MLKHVNNLNLGADPEIFLERRGQIIDSAKVVPKEGRLSAPATFPYNQTRLVRDGVQAELNLAPSSCRAVLGLSIAQAFRDLKKHLDNDMKVNFSSVIELDEAAFQALQEESRVLGCAPSKNHHDVNATIRVDPATYRKRSAGGHIHLGLTDRYNLRKPYDLLVPVLDVLLGNTCVLIDRDPGAAERRTVYGRAGEYRLPPHGLEYRTLSNFWLRSWPLGSFVFGVARMAAALLRGDNPARKREDLLSCVNLQDIIQAINTNDFDLAWSNWKRVRPWLEANFEDNGPEITIWSGSLPLSGQKLDDFEWFVHNGGVEWFFPEDPFTYWTERFRFGTYVGYVRDEEGSVVRDSNGKVLKNPDDPDPNWPHIPRAPGISEMATDTAHCGGWENFLIHRIRPLRLAEQQQRRAV